MTEAIISAVSASVLVNAGILWLLKGWVSARLKASIDAEYEQQHELFVRNLDRKEKVEIISDLFAVWIKVPPGEPMSREHRTKLNQLSFKCSLWLPPALSKEVSKSLQGKEGRKTIFQLLLLARKELIDDEEIGPEHVTFWGADQELEPSASAS